MVAIGDLVVLNLGVKAFILFVPIIYLCACDQILEKKEEEEETAAAVSTTTTVTPTFPAPEVVISNQREQGYLLTPEQYSNMLFQGLEIRLGWEYEGRFYDVITNQLAVGLGGVDFVSSRFRDRLPKVQTQLILRRLAWNAASLVVWREVDPNHEDPTKLFVYCDINEDRPQTAGDSVGSSQWREARLESEKKWILQLEDLYWRIFTRPPSSEEIEILKENFLQVFELNDGWPAPGWTVIIYAMLSSSEFWNL